MCSDIICLTETWIDPQQHFLFDERQLTMASYGRGKGCAMLSKEKPSKTSTFACEKWQLLSNICRDKFQIILVYLSQACDLSEVVNCIERTLNDSIIPIIIGDFNFTETNDNCLLNYFRAKGLVGLVKECTHEAGRSIDNCYVPSSFSAEVTVNFVYYSDHASILVKFK